MGEHRSSPMMGMGGKPDRQAGSRFSELNAVHLIA